MIRAEPELPEGMALLWSRVVAGQEVTRESFDPLQVAYVSVIHNCLIRWGVDAIVAGGQMGAEPPCTLGWAVGQPLSPAFDEWIWNGAKEAREAAIKLGVVKR